jgi:PAS domain S-box-containing protein
VQALPLVGRTPERESLFEFTFPYMSMHGAIVVRDDNKSIGSFSDLRGKRVAVMKGDNMEEFLRREEREFTIRTATTFENALRELSAGQHDAVVIQRLVALRLVRENGIKNLRILNQPIPGFKQDFCFAAKFDDRETLALLNEGLAVLMADGTYRRLYLKWFGALELPGMRTIVVGGDYRYPPFEFLDPQGRPAGYTVDLTRAIAAQMGLNIEFRLEPWTDIVRGLEQGDIDVVQGMFYSASRDAKFDFGPPHLMKHYVAVVRDGEEPPPNSVVELAGKRIVIRRGDMIHGFLVEHGLGDQLAFAETQEDVLRELADGQHDCGVVTRIGALQLIQQQNGRRLRLGASSLYSAEYCYAVADGQAALLMQFSEGLSLAKASGEYRRIRDKWLGVYEEPPIRGTAILKVLGMIGGPVLLVLLGLYTWNWTLRRQVARHLVAFRQSEQQFRSLVEGAPDAVFVQTEDRFVYLNPAACRLLGADSPDQLLGQPVIDRLHPAYHDIVRARIQTLNIEKREVPSHEVVWRRLDGSEVPGSSRRGVDQLPVGPERLPGVRP